MKILFFLPFLICAEVLVDKYFFTREEIFLQTDIKSQINKIKDHIINKKGLTKNSVLSFEINDSHIKLKLSETNKDRRGKIIKSTSLLEYDAEGMKIFDTNHPPDPGEPTLVKLFEEYKRLKSLYKAVSRDYGPSKVEIDKDKAELDTLFREEEKLNRRYILSRKSLFQEVETLFTREGNPKVQVAFMLREEGSESAKEVHGVFERESMDQKNGYILVETKDHDIIEVPVEHLTFITDKKSAVPGSLARLQRDTFLLSKELSENRKRQRYLSKSISEKEERLKEELDKSFEGYYKQDPVKKSECNTLKFDNTHFHAFDLASINTYSQCAVHAVSSLLEEQLQLKKPPVQMPTVSRMHVATFSFFPVLTQKCGSNVNQMLTEIRDNKSNICLEKFSPDIRGKDYDYNSDEILKYLKSFYDSSLEGECRDLDSLYANLLDYYQSNIHDITAYFETLTNKKELIRLRTKYQEIS